MWNPQWREKLYEQQSGLCHWGNGKMSLNQKKNGQPARDFATFEHLIRRQQGGPFNTDNIVLAHRKCNVLKNIEWQASNPYGVLNGTAPVTALKAAGCESSGDRHVSTPPSK